MRIGIYDPYLDDLGGGEKYMMTIASCLSSHHDVSIFWNNKKDLDAVADRFSIDLRKVNLQPNIFSSNTNLLQRLSATQSYDLIIVLSDGSIPLTLSRKLFLHIQQPLSTVESGLLSQFKTTRITGIFYNSSFTRQFNKKYFPNIHDDILYPPVEIHDEPVAKENIILHVGRYRKISGREDDYKKQSFMIEAFKEMVDAGLKDWKFIIAAGLLQKDETEFTKLREAAKGYPVEFYTNVSNTKLFQYYNKAKIYWHASGFGENLEERPELAEHFGISTVEAMGCGTVPVVINAGGQKEIVSHEVNGLVWSTKEEFIQQTLKLVHNATLLKYLSVHAEKRAKDFSEAVFNHKIEEIITS